MKWSHTFPHLKPWCSILLMDLTETSITLPMFISPKTHSSREGKHINAHGSHCCDIGWNIGWPCSPLFWRNLGRWELWHLEPDSKKGKDKEGSKTLLMPWLDQVPALPGPCLLENHKILDCQPGRILESNTIMDGWGNREFTEAREIPWLSVAESGWEPGCIAPGLGFCFFMKAF